MNTAQNIQGSGFPQPGQLPFSVGGRAHSVHSEVTSNDTYLMPSSPLRRPRAGGDSYKPMIARTCGQRPACLVNASVTYCGNNTIFAFGGFDQYTDEGKIAHKKCRRNPGKAR